MTMARDAIHALDRIERLADPAEVTQVEAALRAAIPRGSDLAAGFLALVSLVADLANQDDDPRIRQAVAWAFSLAVSVRLES